MSIKDQVFQLRLTTEEKNKLENTAEEFNEKISEHILNSCDLRNEILEYIFNNDLDDENLDQYKEIVQIIIKNLKI